nr:indolepyruvate ferredoxin oxidoreductase subunit alpha [Maliibacterium massiliense]
MKEKTLLLGNQAFARGAYEAGVRVAVAYPGTPSTEITENAAKYEEIYAEWAPNEKVAMEVGAGASIAGARTLVCFKHVGLNVAADPVFTFAYTGVNAGLVIIVADDPGMHSSQNEQDSRYYARAAHIPMLEPADSNEAVQFVKLGYELSELYDTPVFIRSTTRLSHARGVVALSERQEVPLRDYVKDEKKFVMLPGHARTRHVAVEARDARIAKDASDMPINRIEWGDKSIGIIASGVPYQYVKEAMPEASVLKLGMVNPLPMDLIRSFAQQVDRLVVAEELEPVIQEQVLAAGIACEGKNLFSRQGELSTALVAAAFGRDIPVSAPIENLPPRPPVMCPGCPHRATFRVLNKMKLHVSGDIGCYTLGALPPASAMDVSICMGSSISAAHGMQKARGRDFAKETVAVIGDSTFFHSGVTGLIEMVYNKGCGTVLVLDNRTTGMTGHQDHPATGKTLKGELTTEVDIAALARACGVSSVHTVDPFDMDALEARLKEELRKDEPSVIVCKRPCALLKGQASAPLAIDGAKCKNCGMCMRLGCPAIEKHAQHPQINASLCNGCGLCARVCPFEAIGKAE